VHPRGALARLYELAQDPVRLALQRRVDRTQGDGVRRPHRQAFLGHGKADAAAARAHQCVPHQGVAQAQLAARLRMPEDRGRRPLGALRGLRFSYDIRSY